MEDSARNASLLIKGAEIWSDSAFRRLDLLVRDGKIEKLAPEIAPEAGIKTLDARGCYLLPGLVDLHVHFRDPGFTYKETIATGSAAAAAGGFTTVCSMPNIKPVPDSDATLRAQEEVIARDAVVEVLPYASITKLRMGAELVDYAALAPRVAGFSDDGTGVQSEEVMRRAMQGVAANGALLAAHCEVESLLNKGYVHDGEWARAHGHRGICSRSEWEEVERDIRLAAETGCRLHICHVSTAESIEAVRRGKAAGVKVTCETGPHYLTFCDEDMQDEGRFKMNPPLRARRDMEALRAAVADGTVDCVATDHAPHSAEEKSRGLEKSAMGVVGLETSLAATYTAMVASGRMPLERLVEVMSLAPRRLLGRDTDVIRPGAKADFTLVDFNRRKRVDPSTFRSKGRSTPFDGMELHGEVLLTVAGGKTVFDNTDKPQS